MNIDRPEWQQHGSCRGMNTELFMPKRGDIYGIRQAQKICAGCPVIQQCRDYGLQLETQGLVFGIFGGLTQYNREKIIQEERRTGQPSHLRTVNTSGLSANGNRPGR